jgi:four helix bundle suffix protein
MVESNNKIEKTKLISTHGGYRKLRSYQMAEIVYDGTVKYCNRFIDKRSRTHDQMVQAARSGKQNIAEGCMASGTSTKIELKLIGIARASLEELLLDYEDYIRQNDLNLWDMNDPKSIMIRKISLSPDKSYQSYKTYIEEKDKEVSSNTMICIINQTNYLLDRQLKTLEEDFLKNGGFTERMYRIRKDKK